MLAKGRIYWRRGTYACVRGAYGRLRGAYACQRGAYGRSHFQLSLLCPLTNVFALPSVVCTSYTHAKNAGIESHLTFEYAMLTYSINEG
jgi:hypothetical protein